MTLFLGVDAGGTKTDYALGNERRVLARVRGESIKRLKMDAERAGENLREGLARLEAEAGVSLAGVARTCVGAAGERAPVVMAWLKREFGARVGGELRVVADVEIALDAAFQGGPGVLVLAGTGSNVAGRDERGRLTTAGGWGPALGDEGSGHRIGQEGLRAGFRARDEGEQTGLLEAVMERWGLPSVDHLVEKANMVAATEFAELSGVVARCAAEGDRVARRVLEREGRELGRLAELVVRRLAQDGWVPAVALAGSIMEQVPEVRKSLTAGLRERFPGIEVREEVVDPIEGALWRARGAPQP